MNQVAFINLNGDYVIPDTDGVAVVGSTSTDPNLEALDAFLASLRGSVNADDQFSRFTSAVMERLKLPVGSVVLSITSKVKDNAIIYDFSFSAKDRAS